jgi:hypothetical protein
MKELFYFSFADLMARIEYQQSANSLRYSTHREMTLDERVIVEHYLLTTFAVKTDYYKRPSALFYYLGVDARLKKDLAALDSRNPLREPVESEKEVEASVSGLISQSMLSYYSEQIGDTILAARRELANTGAGLANERRHRRKVKLKELIKAYNTYADQKITMDKIIPAELKSCFDLAGEREYFQRHYSVPADGPSEWAEERV